MTATPLPTWVRRLPESGGPRLAHVNATSAGGGVAELLHGLVPAQLAAGTAAGWSVISGDAEFFRLTKRLHHLLHGRGDPEPLRQSDQAELYRRTLAPQARWLSAQLRPGDVVALHDPQTLGMAPALAAAGATVVWHCHIGTAAAGDPRPAEVWRFFAPELAHVAAVFTARLEFAPPHGPRSRRQVAPAISMDAPKNRPLSPERVASLLAEMGLTAATGAKDAVVWQEAPLPAAAPMVLQVSRWDPLKDMAGVLRCLPALPRAAHLVLAGPDPTEIPDDPEGVAVLTELRGQLAAMPDADRARAHVVVLSMRDAERNGLFVNALQRRADVVVQKSMEEGFGLTVTEAMAKRRAVVAADVGGLRSQIEHGVTGLLVNPADHAAAAEQVGSLLMDAARRAELGERAAAAVAQRYLMPRLVADYRSITHPLTDPKEAPRR